MKYIKTLLKILLFLFLIALIMSFVIENIVVNTFSQEILSRRVSEYLLNEIVSDVDTNNLETIDDSIRNSESTKKITAKFINTVIQNIVNNEEIEMNIEDDVDTLILEYMPDKISNEKLRNMRANIVKKITNTEEGLQDDLLYSFGDNYLIILTTYNIITNIYFRIIIAILSLIDMVILCILEKYKVLRTIRNISIIITIVMLGTFMLIKMLSNFIGQRLAGGWIQQINTNAVIISIVIASITTILLIIIDRIVNLKFKKDESNA